MALVYPTDDTANVLPMDSLDTAVTTTAVISPSNAISHELLEPPSVYDIGMYALNLYETLAFLMPLMISDRYQSVSKSELTTTFWLFVATNVRILISLKHSAGASEGWVWGLPPTEKLPPGWLHGQTYYVSLYAYPLGTVVFDANNHEAN